MCVLTNVTLASFLEQHITKSFPLICLRCFVLGFFASIEQNVGTGLTNKLWSRKHSTHVTSGRCLLLYCIFLLANVGDLPEYFQIPKIVYLCFFLSPHSTILWWNYAYLCQIVSIFYLIHLWKHNFGKCEQSAAPGAIILDRSENTCAYLWMSTH